MVSDDDKLSVEREIKWPVARILFRRLGHAVKNISTAMKKEGDSLTYGMHSSIVLSYVPHYADTLEAEAKKFRELATEMEKEFQKLGGIQGDSDD